MERVIVDLASCNSGESAYVMVSRAKSLDGLFVFRPFPKSKITQRQKEDLKIEMHRLHVLALRTKVQYGSNIEKDEAATTLRDLEHQRIGSTRFTAVAEESVSKKTRTPAQENDLVDAFQSEALKAFKGNEPETRERKRVKRTHFGSL